MTLMAMPIELMTSIISYIDPCDILNFASTCKFVYLCSVSRLREQQSMKPYHKIELEIKKEQDTIRILSEIFKNPRISFYARRLCVTGKSTIFTNQRFIEAISPLFPALSFKSLVLYFPHFLSRA